MAGTIPGTNRPREAGILATPGFPGEIPGIRGIVARSIRGTGET